MKASVIIPTYHRAAILRRCLDALVHQEGATAPYEIIVVNDGGTDETPSVVKEFQDRFSSIPIAFLTQSNQGQGAARNLGVAQAKNDIVIFIGDDIFVQNDFIARHLAMHHAHPAVYEAVLGKILWAPDLTMTPLMEFLMNGSTVLGHFGGAINCYEKLKGKTTVDFNFFYGSNVSLKRELALKFPFDAKFDQYGWEDIEIGYRLQKDGGMVLYYEPNAIGYHYHRIDEALYAHRMRSVGKTAKIFHRKYPELRKVPPPWKKAVFEILAATPTMKLFDLGRKMFPRRFTNWYYYAFSKKYFLEGLQE